MKFLTFMQGLVTTVGIWILVLSAFLLWILSNFIGDANQINLLADTSRARGLITFIVTVGSIGVAIVVALAAFTMQSTAQDKWQERFDRGKEVFTALVGILGTIIGFYFGTQDSSSQRSLGVVNLSVQPDNIKSKEELTIMGNIVGGQAPYTYSIEFITEMANDALTRALNISAKTSATGRIVERIQAPAVSGATQLSFQIIVRDQNGFAFVAPSSSPVTISPLATSQAVPPPSGGSASSPPPPGGSDLVNVRSFDDVKVVVPVARVRSEPNLRARVVSRARAGDVLMVRERRDDWLYVDLSGGFGWVRTDLVSSIQP